MDFPMVHNHGDYWWVTSDDVDLLCDDEEHARKTAFDIALIDANRRRVWKKNQEAIRDEYNEALAFMRTREGYAYGY